MWNNVLLCFVASGILNFLFPALPVIMAQEGSEPLVDTFGSEQSSFAEVVTGGVGTAYLVYYLPENSAEQPSLVVRLSRGSSASDALAEVFDTPPGEDYVPLQFVKGLPVVPNSLQPVVRLTAHDGWWVRDGLVNYNLDIIVYGPIMSMWASGGDIGWVRRLDRGDENSRIVVRDQDGDGMPDWDWRTMLPEFSDRGDLRTNYAERKCTTPLEVDMGLSPEWPFVAFDGDFEQKTGSFRPPIVVDWMVGRVSIFSEIVTLRHQNCSYGMYSISRVLPEQQNDPNFETPFAFYDLSGEGVGYPNLLLRTVRIKENDKSMFQDNNPEIQSIRYSWRNQVGDLLWDYKVDVLGQYHYDNETPIAGGAASIDAPAHEDFPKWVVDRDWWATSFVAIEDKHYRSSEGIYDWSMLLLTNEYSFGWQQDPDLVRFEDIEIGVRGEYRLNSNHRPETYFSLIDNRLHLKWAENGIWRLDNEQIIRVANLDNNETIDVWFREVMAVSMENDVEAEASNDPIMAMAPEIIEALYALDGYLLHTDDSRMTLVKAEYDPMLFETMPPTDHDTWETHRTQLNPYKDHRRDPTNLYAWLNVFSGSRSELDGASLANVRITNEGFRFELSLESGYSVAGPDLLGLSGLAPGEYVVENRAGVFSNTPLVPAALDIDLQQLVESGAAALAQVTIHNDGTADAPNLTLVVESVDEDGVAVEHHRDPVDVLGREIVELLVDIPSVAAGKPKLRFRLEDAEEQILAVTEQASAGMPPADPDAIFDIGQIPVLIPVLFIAGILLAATAVLALWRREQSSA